MLFDPGRGISIDEKNRVSRGINFIFIFGLIRQGAFGGLAPGAIYLLKLANVPLCPVVLGLSPLERTLLQVKRFLTTLSPLKIRLIIWH